MAQASIDGAGKSLAAARTDSSAEAESAAQRSDYNPGAPDGRLGRYLGTRVVST